MLLPKSSSKFPLPLSAALLQARSRAGSSAGMGARDGGRNGTEWMEWTTKALSTFPLLCGSRCSCRRQWRWWRMLVVPLKAHSWVRKILRGDEGIENNNNNKNAFVGEWGRRKLSCSHIIINSMSNAEYFSPLTRTFIYLFVATITTTAIEFIRRLAGISCQGFTGDERFCQLRKSEWKFLLNRGHLLKHHPDEEFTNCLQLPHTLPFIL